MTQDLLVDLGEEYLMKNGFDAITVTVGLYDDSTDALSDTSDVTSTINGTDSDVSTEPTNTNYARQSATFTASDLSGNWGVDNDSLFSFDFSDITTSQNVDTAFIAYSFTAADTGDTSSELHLLANPALTQSRDIGSIDTLEIAAGDLQVTVN